MKESTRARVGVYVRLLWVLCPIFACYAIASPPPPSSWRDGLAALEAGDAARATNLFTEYIEEEGAKGEQSPDAHYNLGLALWKLKRHGPAVKEWIESASLATTPWAAAQKLALLNDAQRELGIHDGTTEHLFFRLYLFANRDLATLLYCIAAWAIGGMLLLRWRGIKLPSRALYAAPLIFAALGAGVSTAHDRLFHFGVLEAESSDIPLYRAPGDSQEKKLADLPDGTVVMVGKSEAGFTQISYPVVGWVPEPRLVRIASH